MSVFISIQNTPLRTSHYNMFGNNLPQGNNIITYLQVQPHPSFFDRFLFTPTTAWRDPFLAGTGSEFHLISVRKEILQLQTPSFTAKLQTRLCIATRRRRAVLRAA